MKKLILALTIGTLFASCQYKEDVDPIDVSKTAFVMDGYWMLKGGTWRPDVNDETSTPVDDYAPMPGCVKDNFYQFKTSNRVTLFEGLTKCIATAEDSTVLGYALTKNDSHLRIYSNPDDEPDLQTTIIEGGVKFPSIDSFVVTYDLPHPSVQDVTSRYTRTFVKFK